VLFDLDADGVLERIGWTEPESQVAFLVLDRNGNGFVDDGTELFGDVTPQPESPNPNGFRALRMFDRAVRGGNEDGRITRADRVFSTLSLWIDSNHDGFSQASELLTLQAGGVLAIDLDFRVINRRDRHGNLFRYISFVDLVASGRRPCYDVFFVKLAEPD
jgi:hypothetical protein